MRKSTSRKILSLLLSICMFFSLQFMTFGSDVSDNVFSDVSKNAWYYDEVLYVNRLGIMLGVDHKAFFPEENTTRAEMVTILYRMAGEPDISAESRFNDLTQEWYKNAVFWASENQITKGTDDTSFSPDRTISRSEMVTFLYRYALYKGIGVISGESENDLDRFSDSKKVAKYAVPAMLWAVKNGIINGFSTEKPILAPEGNSSRAQIAAVIARFYENCIVEKRVDGVYSLVNQNGSVFFSDPEQGTFYIDSEKESPVQISEIGGSLLSASEELFCWNSESGQVYQVTENSFSFIGNISENAQLIGKSNEVFYWYPVGLSDKEKGLYRTDINSEKTELFLPMSEYLLTACFIGDVIYYQTETGVICSFDPIQKESSVITREFEEKYVTEEGSDATQFYQSGKCIFCDDFAVIPVQSRKKDSSGGYVVDKDGVYQIFYKTGKSTCIKEEKMSSNFSLYDHNLYFVTMKNEGQSYLQSCDLNSGTVETDLSSSDLIHAIEIAVNGEKCYYTVPGTGVSGGGIYCYDFATGHLTKIYKSADNRRSGEQEMLYER